MDKPTPTELSGKAPYNGFPYDGPSPIGKAEIDFLKDSLLRRSDIDPNIRERLAFTFETVMQACSGETGMQVLDVGCNTGIFSKTLARAGNYVLGIDINPKKILIARKDCVRLGDNIRFEQHDITTGLPTDIESESMDVCVCTEVLEHIPQYQIALENIFKAIKPNGLLMLSVPREGLVYDPGHINIFDRQKLDELLEPYGEVEFVQRPGEQPRLNNWLYALVKKYPEDSAEAITRRIDHMRTVYKSGDYPSALRIATELDERAVGQPHSALYVGHASKQLGLFDNAISAYQKAVSIMRGSRGHNYWNPDIIAISKRLVRLSVFTGDYKTAHQLTQALAKASDQDAIRTIRSNQRHLASETERAFASHRFKDSIDLAIRTLCAAGRSCTETEIYLANALLMKERNTPLLDLVASTKIAHRIVLTNPNNHDAQMLIAFASEIARLHPQRNLLPMLERNLLLTSDLRLIRRYTAVLRTLPEHHVALDKYRQHTTADFFENLSRMQEKYGAPDTPDLLPSPRLESNPQADLVESQETHWYWDRHTKEHRDLIEDLDSQIAKPMDASCRMAICIPAFMEEKNIYRTLEAIAKQKGIKPEEFEVIVLENHPDTAEYKRDNTAAEIARFKRNHPQMIIHTVYHKFVPEEAVMGRIRKTVFDLALRRGMKRRKTKEELILGSFDADFWGAKPRALRNVIDSFDQSSKLDIIGGRMDFPPQALIKFPTIHALLRFTQYYDTLKERIFGRQQSASSGAFSFFRTSIYAAITGYSYTRKRGSDTELGRRIMFYRKNNLAERYLRSNLFRFETDPRRLLSKMVVGLHFDDHWRDIDWQGDRRVFGKDWTDFEDPTLETLDRDRFEEELNDVIKKRVNLTSSARRSEINRMIMHEALGFLGVDYHIQGDRVILDDISRLQQALEQYRQAHANS